MSCEPSDVMPSLQNSMPRWGLMPSRNGMLDHRHLRDEVGHFQKRGLGITPRDHDVQHGAFLRELRHHVGQRQVIVAEHDVELVEDHHVERWIAQELDGFLPRALGRRDVALAVLRLPGEPFAQGVNLDSLARFREAPPLPSGSLP